MRSSLIAAALFLCTVLALGRAHPFGNPRAEPANGLGALLKDADMNTDAKAVLVTKCADCHSYETRWPAYAHLAPGSWLIERDVVKGRAQMNLSRWSQLSPDLQQVLKAKILTEAKSGAMPPLQYRVLHWSAGLSAHDISVLSTMGKDGPAEAAATGSGDAVHGKTLFEKRCTGCHALEVNREGPRLGGVFEREAGTVPGYAYSAGLKHASLRWTGANLERWLSDPDLFIPDNNMSFSVRRAQERRDLIAYLEAGGNFKD